MSTDLEPLDASGVAPVTAAPKHGVGMGLLIGVLLHVVCQGALAVTLPDVGGTSTLAIGASQLAYMVPAVVIAAVKRERGIVKGLLIVAGVTFLLNAACFGFFFATFSLH